MALYFQTYNGYFWEFAENREVIAIPGGSTLAYRGLIENALEALYQQGIPRFGTLLMVLAALNPDGKRQVGEIKEILFNLDRVSSQDEIKPAWELLFRLAEVPEDMRQRDQKWLLLRAIFEKSHSRIGKKKARLIYQAFKEKREVDEFTSLILINSDDLYRDLRPLALLGAKFPTVASILDRMANIPALEEELEIPREPEPNPQGDTDEDLIAQLESHQETFKIGSLIRHLWSGLNIPFHSRTPSQQPFGGVSDITNKGDINQLLVSEYANEDVIFLARLANAEALYYSRESPPSAADKHRDILIDISIKNWGTPKLVSFATMLAIAHHPRSRMTCQVYLVGSELVPIENHDIKALIAAVQWVNSDMDASAGLQIYFEQSPPDRNKEVFFLTERTSLQGAALQQTLSEWGSKVNYLILNDLEGGIDIYRNTLRDRKHLQHLELPLARLWQKKERPPRSPAPSRQTTSPSKYPILIDPPNESKSIRALENGEIFLLTRYNTILWHPALTGDRPEHAWKILLDDLPIRPQGFEVGRSSIGETLVLIWRNQNREVHLINLDTGGSFPLQHVRWRQTAKQCFVFREGKFHYHPPGNGGLATVDESGGLSSSWESIPEFYRNHHAEIIDQASRYPRGSTLQKLKRVGISKMGGLVLNGSVLVLVNGKIELASQFVGVQDMVNASRIEKNKFQFRDGTLVEMKVPGLVEVTKPDETEPSIFIPTTLNSPLGIATSEVWGGNSFYLDPPRYRVELRQAGNNKLQAVKAVKLITGKGLADSKRMVESELPVVLEKSFMRAEYKKALETLQMSGMNFDIQALNHPGQDLRQVSGELLYTQYLMPFFLRTANS